MEIVFIDPEPPDIIGGGIRTYLKLAIKICLEKKYKVRIYSNNPKVYEVFLGFESIQVIRIERTLFLKNPLKTLAYRYFSQENALWEQSKWLALEIEKRDQDQCIYEFADYLGFGYFSIKNINISKRIILRIHTPNFIIPKSKNIPDFFPKNILSKLRKQIQEGLDSYREKFCLNNCQLKTAPSSEFIYEKLPHLKNWVELKNPFPKLDSKSSRPKSLEKSRPKNFLYLGRIEPRKGVLILIQSFLEVAIEEEDITLTLIGSIADNHYYQQILNFIQKSPLPIQRRIIWEQAYQNENKKLLFQRFDALLIPSLFENSPYVFFEGMAAGLICLGSNTGEMKSVSQKLGFPFPQPGNLNDWVNAIKSLRQLPMRELIEKQFKYLEENGPIISNNLSAYYLSVVTK